MRMTRHSPQALLLAVAFTFVISAGCAQGTLTQIIPFTLTEVRQLFRLQWPGTFGFGGHAFLLDRPGARPMALTAFHVAGPLPPSAGAAVTTAFLVHPVEDSVGFRLGERVPIPGARTITAGDSQHDLAAFLPIDWDPTRALQLAASMPAVGDTVFVLAVHIGSGGSDQHPLSGPRRHKAVVSASDSSSFVYRYTGSENSNFTSGAAVLNRDGRVVAVNVGTTTSGGGVSGIGVGLNAIRALLPP
jgi:hypothetical protein